MQLFAKTIQKIKWNLKDCFIFKKVVETICVSLQNYIINFTGQQIIDFL